MNIESTASYQKRVMIRTHELILHKMALTDLSVSGNIRYITDNFAYTQNEYVVDFTNSSLELQRTNN